MYIGLSIVSVYLLLLPYFTVNKDFHNSFRMLLHKTASVYFI